MTDTDTSVVENAKYRLGYHFMPPAGWMNDPNGFIEYRGHYHLFYQHWPESAEWGPMHWGHAVSPDLLRWEHLPIALAPSEPYDSAEGDVPQGCFSGSAWALPSGDLALFYTGHVDGQTPMQTQNMAVSADGINFQKLSSNPIIPAPPAEGGQDFRDPRVFEDAGRILMTVGSTNEGRGNLLLYEAENAELTDWKYVGVAAESDGTQGSMWECPDLFGLDGKYCLLYSPMQGSVNSQPLVAVGQFDAGTGKFTAQAERTLDYGIDFYAPQTMVDKAGRRIMIAWMQQWFQKNVTATEGWAGAMTVPRELTLSGDHLVQTPVTELETLRVNHRVADFGNGMIQAPMQAELRLTVEVKSGTGFRLAVKCAEDRSEETVYTVDVARQQVTCDRSLAGEGDPTSSTAPLLHLDKTDARMVDLHLFLDTCSAELFLNQGSAVMTNRVYPQASSTGMVLEPIGEADLNILRADLWELKKVIE